MLDILKRKIKRKLIIISVCIIVGLAIFGALIDALYGSPIGIFLPKLDDGKDVADSVSDDTVLGYQSLIDPLTQMYVDFNAEVYARQDDKTEVRYDDERTNFWDVMKIYVVLAGETESAGTPNNVSTLSSENEALLQQTFDYMNETEDTEEIRSKKDGDKLGNYGITVNYGHSLYDSDPDYGECIVSKKYEEKIPVNAVVKINKVYYRVVAAEDLKESYGLSICKPAEDDWTLKKTNYNVYFLSTPEVKTIDETITVVIVHNWRANDYYEKYSLTKEQVSSYNELKDYDVAEMMGTLDGEGDTDYEENVIGIITTPLTLTQTEFIDAVGQAAQSYYEEYEILPSFTIAQACLESRYGQSGLATQSYNFFGMKWVKGCGCDYREWSTYEEVNGNKVQITAKFRHYTSIETGIQGYYQFLEYGRYSNMKGVTDCEVACDTIASDGWATSSTYARDLKNVIKSYNLTRFDTW